MQPREFRRLAGTFALAVLLVIGVTAGAGLVTSYTASNASSQPDAPAYDTDALLPTAVPDAGSVEEPSAASSKTVVVDASHGNAISRAAMQPLVDALTRAGHEVRFFSGGSSSGLGFSSSGASPLTGVLADADALVVANPATAYTADEVDSIESFTDDGGRLLLLADTPSQATASTSLLGLSTGTTGAASGQPDAVASRFGITFDAGYLYDMEENANNFRYVYGSTASDGALAAGADRTVFNAAVPVVTSDESTTVLATRDVNYSATREHGTYAVAVRNGNVAAVGDTWFLSPEGATLADNEALVGNVASFLVSGSKETDTPTGNASTTTAA